MSSQTQIEEPRNAIITPDQRVALQRPRRSDRKRLPSSQYIARSRIPTEHAATTQSGSIVAVKREQSPDTIPVKRKYEETEELNVLESKICPRIINRCFVDLPSRKKRVHGRDPAAIEEQAQSRMPPYHTEEETKAFFASLFHPDIKVKVKKDFSLENVVYDRLKTLGFTEKLKLDLSHRMRTFTVRRTWMSTNLGGCVQKMIGRPSDEKKARHGYPHFLYLSHKYHPDSPKSQGVPGVFYSICDFQEGYPAETRVFVNLSQDGDYYYMGNYKVQQAAPLTSYEWSLVPARIRTAWTTVMSTALWAREIRIRITLRMQLAPGEELGMAAIEAASAQRDKYLGVTAQQIHQAIVDGQERIYVWCLKPVEYDEEFLGKLMGWVEDTERGDAPQF